MNPALLVVVILAASCVPWLLFWALTRWQDREIEVRSDPLVTQPPTARPPAAPSVLDDMRREIVCVNRHGRHHIGYTYRQDRPVPPMRKGFRVRLGPREYVNDN